MIATSGFLAALGCTNFVFGRPGLRPGPRWGSFYSAPPDPLAALRRATSEGRKGRGRRRERGRGGDRREGKG